MDRTLDTGIFSLHGLAARAGRGSGYGITGGCCAVELLWTPDRFLSAGLAPVSQRGSGYAVVNYINHQLSPHDFCRCVRTF
jgi:hypothetical protein